MLLGCDLTAQRPDILKVIGNVSRKSPLATKNLLEDTDGLLRGATQSISDLSMR